MKHVLNISHPGINFIEKKDDKNKRNDECCNKNHNAPFFLQYTLRIENVNT